MSLWEPDTVYVFRSNEYCAQWGTYRDARTKKSRKCLGVRWPERNFPANGYFFIEADMVVGGMLQSIMVALNEQSPTTYRNELIQNCRTALDECQVHSLERFVIAEQEERA
jgi:hypothetical protein